VQTLPVGNRAKAAANRPVAEGIWSSANESEKADEIAGSNHGAQTSALAKKKRRRRRRRKPGGDKGTSAKKEPSK
jgi:hypothetical protein